MLGVQCVRGWAPLLVELQAVVHRGSVLSCAGLGLSLDLYVGLGEPDEVPVPLEAVFVGVCLAPGAGIARFSAPEDAKGDAGPRQEGGPQVIVQLGRVRLLGCRRFDGGVRPGKGYPGVVDYESSRKDVALGVEAVYLVEGRPGSLGAREGVFPFVLQGDSSYEGPV